MKNNDKVYADLMISNGNIATLDERGTMARAVAVKDGKILAVGSDEDVAQYKGPDTQVIDAGKRTVIPGLNDSHLHVILDGVIPNEYEAAHAFMLQRAKKMGLKPVKE